MTTGIEWNTTYWLIIWCVVALINILSIFFGHHKALEHTKWRSQYPREKADRIAHIYGFLGGYLFFLTLTLLWLLPQSRFVLPNVKIIKWNFTYISFLVFGLCFVCSFILGIGSVTKLSLNTSQYLHANEVIKTGVYGFVRHPQYLACLLAHIGFCFLMSGILSVMYTPALLVLLFLMSKKEEKELMKEFGDYKEYKSQVPMYIPTLNSCKKQNPNKWKGNNLLTSSDLSSSLSSNDNSSSNNNENTNLIK
ncbi:protein-s-isoprenylcysteine o-methyltransferase [Anaeramoeba flamelloides]|uniref:Protein-S-isoprenylcysteine O-methyltransferase n=1 Tax=Anaeramoeba flamelloides TaxID=1746091 RepID=A0AAV7ZGQ8_9EUKA|nr:protein-s-isoprenylcysteine o-methyltransferase [Anaeramoeba flamelloides]KAJ6255293.1 protein-s-isoprenylcysteine o-methyltransferase [Anaeramoeba flamelloides]